MLREREELLKFKQFYDLGKILEKLNNCKCSANLDIGIKPNDVLSGLGPISTQNPTPVVKEEVDSKALFHIINLNKQIDDASLVIENQDTVKVEAIAIECQGDQ